MPQEQFAPTPADAAPPTGTTFAGVLGDLIVTSANQYAAVLPANLSQRSRALAVAGFRDGMRTMIQHLHAMGVIAIVHEGRK